MKVPGKELDAATEAKRILDSVTVDDVPKLRFWRGEFWWWEKGAYREQSKDEIRARVITHLNANTFALTSRVVNDILDQTKAQSIMPAIHDAPRWLAGEKPWPADEVLAARNGLFHLPSIVDRKENWREDPTPRFFATSALDYDFDPKADRPTEWLRFLGQLWGDDPESVALLQMWMGCLIRQSERRLSSRFLSSFTCWRAVAPKPIPMRPNTNATTSMIAARRP